MQLLWFSGGRAIATAVCVGDGFSVANWIPVNQPELNCGRNLTTDEKLQLLNQVDVTEENVMEVATQVVVLTEDAAALTDNGVTSTADIMEKVTSVNSVAPEVISDGKTHLLWCLSSRAKKQYSESLPWTVPYESSPS